MASSSSTSAAALRLQRDLKELNDVIKELAGIKKASPLQDDLFKWEVVFRPSEGAYVGKDIEMSLQFSHDYPNKPPAVILLTPGLRHPNVFYGWGPSPYICLDMLKPPEHYSKPYSGWSTSYTVSSVLLQLYGFLLVDETILQEGGGRAIRQNYMAYFNSLGASRSGPAAATAPAPAPVPAGPRVVPGAEGWLPEPRPQRRRRGNRHTRRSDSPDSSTTATTGFTTPDTATTRDTGASPSHAHPGKSATAAAADQKVAWLEQLDDAVLARILDPSSSFSESRPNSQIQPQDLWRCISAGSPRLARLAMDALQRTTLVCFHSKLPYSQCLLGYGVGRTWHGPNRQHTGSARAALRSLSTKADYLSYEAFASGVRMSAWNMPFDSFLPLYLNPTHGKRALALLPAAVVAILRPGSTCIAEHPVAVRVPPSDMLYVLSQLMNSLLVEIVDVAGASQQSQGPRRRSSNSNDIFEYDSHSPPAPRVTSHMSDAALAAFCHLHHLLLAAALQPGSQLVAQAVADVRAFVQAPSPAQRSKSHFPDLGVLLVKLLLVPVSLVSWADFAPPFLQELLCRQVYWAVKQEGDRFAQPMQLSDDMRLTQHFSSAKVSMRNVMLQAWFANALARPTGDTTTPAPCPAPAADTTPTHAPAPTTPAEVAVAESPRTSSSSWDDVDVDVETMAAAMSALQPHAGGKASGPAPATAGRILQQQQGGSGSSSTSGSGGGSSNLPPVSPLVYEQLAAIKRQYDECSGAPPPRMFQSFNTYARRVVQVSDWTGFLAGLRLGLRAAPGVSPRATWVACLRQAVVDSQMAGYHRRPAFGVMLPKPLADTPTRGDGDVSWQQVGGSRRREREQRPRWAYFMDWEATPPVAVVSDKWL